MERKSKEKDSMFLLMCLDDGWKGKGKRKYYYFKLFLYQKIMTEYQEYDFTLKTV